MNPDPRQPQSHSLPALVRTLRDETTTLWHQEVSLAKAEFGEKLSEFGKNAVQLAMGGGVAYAGVILLLFGFADLVGMILIRVGLDDAMATWLSRAVVGVVVALVGWLMIVKAKKSMSTDTLKPEKTLDALQDDKQWAENKLQQS